jgi:AraC family transcriptional regulator
MEEMNSTANQLEPRTVRGAPLLLAGYSENYTFDRRSHIPAQWQRFAPLIGRVPGQIGKVAYGVCSNAADGRSFDYLTAVEVADASALGDPLSVLSLPARDYAIFTHEGNVSALHVTLDQIWQHWSRRHGERIAKAPFFERYGESFDPATGNGGVDIWIPLKA